MTRSRKRIQRIRVGGIWFTIKRVAMVSSDQEDSGKFEGFERTIKLDRKLTPEQEKFVLLHEISHCVLFMSGLTNVINSEHKEEAICDAMELMLGQVVDFSETSECIEWG